MGVRMTRFPEDSILSAGDDHVVGLQSHGSVLTTAIMTSPDAWIVLQHLEHALYRIEHPERWRGT